MVNENWLILFHSFIEIEMSVWMAQYGSVATLSQCFLD